jgi:hypothetical protein
MISLLTACTVDSNSDTNQNGNEAISGSYSTMLTLGNNLYAVTKSRIFTFDISNPQKPVERDNKDVGFNIESLFYYDGLLFIGSSNNMYIYSLDENGIPERESNTQYNDTEFLVDDFCKHDPIVVRNNIAYVTLSTTLTGICVSRTFNQLRLYNIADIKNPVLLSIHEMSNPKGLGFGKEKLFVCDGIDGLVVFDIKNPLMPVKEKTIGGYKAYDLIIKDNLLVVVSDKELYQYDITDEDNIQLYSKINL